LASLGAVLADFDRALQGFSHPAMHRHLHWDVKRANKALEHISLLTPEQQKVVQLFMEHWAGIDWNSLRHSLIHGDANDYNILVRDGRVVGLIDFGDMVYSATACDLAIALAYSLLGHGDPLAAAGVIIRSYHRRFALTEPEIDALYPLMTARLCMSLCYSAYNSRAKHDDPYQQVTAGPGWAALQLFSAIPEASARRAFHQACASL
jgi:Ser/Thr protein kinase RdoA (MazF antagonist)